MMKDYQGWYAKKSDINEIKKNPFFHEREIWFCYLGANVGFEQDGSEEFLRPVVVFRKFNNDVFWAIPLTKSNKKLSRHIGTIPEENFEGLKKKLKALLP